MIEEVLHADMDQGLSNGLGQLQFSNRPDDNENPQLAVNIIPLPAELIYDILDYLPNEDVIAFVSCRWDFFQASIDFLIDRVGPAFQGLDSLVKAVIHKNWPKQWLWDLMRRSKSGKSSLRGFKSLLNLFEQNEWPEKVLRNIVSACAKHGSPISHSCLNSHFYEGAILYLQEEPNAALDMTRSQMSVLQSSILLRATKCVEIIEAILQDMTEPERVAHINYFDDFSNTALDYAVRISPVPIIDALIRLGADFDNRDKLGFTPLMNACHLGRDEAIHCLIDHGANVTATNNFGESALESNIKNTALLHAFKNNKQFLDLFLECGAEGPYIGLPERIISLDLVDGQSSAHMQQQIPSTLLENVAESQTSGIEPQRRSSPIDGTEVDEGQRGTRDDHISRTIGALKINDMHSRVDAWGYIGTGCFSIMRIGSLEACKYIFKIGLLGNTESLQKVSDSQSRISHITYIDEMGRTQRLYGRENVQEITGDLIPTFRTLSE
ncbi:hypothetical protein N7520_009733 [Penicillium odoratum]|uniref:uncharacterized protein n=1 Tax=Penicillium odoratum TaxID=1167516 RepID=UPI002548746D|nr:uncharacterized protein N7520_009733 [Penicillium odoratum]KAJ5752816.1 hypothetical protein N7520_009733 [Penicillium odoratum]